MTEREEFEKYKDWVSTLTPPERVAKGYEIWQAARAPLLLEIEQLKAEMKEGK